MSLALHTESKACRRLPACLVALVCALALFLPGAAWADVRTSDLIAGQTVQDAGIPSSQCPSIAGDYAIVMDSDGNVYFERDADAQVHIASITKVMTAVVALDSVPLDTQVTISHYAASIGESTASLKEGDTMPLSEALKALLWPSGNDAAEAIAETVGAIMLKSEGQDSSDTTACAARFVQAMNDKASELGMTNTVYANPHGLDDAAKYPGEMHSTARDVATLVAYAAQKSAITDITGTDGGICTVTRSGQTIELKLESTDQLLGSYEGAFGIKTGFTDSAGECFAGAVNKNGVTLYSVVLQSSSEKSRFTDTSTLWDWVYNHRIDYALAQTDQTTTDENGNEVPLVAEVSDGAWTDKTVNATLADPSATVNVFDLHGNISQSVEYRDLSGTVNAGDVVGTITYYQHNEVVATQDLVATETVQGPGVLDTIGIWWTRLTAGITGAQTEAQSELYNETPLINDRTQA